MSRWKYFTENAALLFMTALLLQSPSVKSRTASTRAPSSANAQLQPTPGTPAPRGIQSYRRFHANDSFIWKSIPCSAEVKICFRYNTLYEPVTGHCVFPPQSLQCVGDGRDFLKGSGRLHATCPKYRDPCPGYRMAFDGRCYPKQMVRDVICGCPEPPTAHFLGGVECRCDPAPCPAYVRQPPQRGRCHVPDLRFPDSSYDDTPLRRIARGFSTNNLTLNCSPEQKRCFSQEKVWVASAQGCFPLGQKGPCPDGQVVTLQKSGLAMAPAVCRPENGGCALGSFRMAFDGKCHKQKEMEVVASSILWRNLVGEFEIHLYKTSLNLYPAVARDVCYIFVDIALRGEKPQKQLPMLNCAGRNSGLCSVEAEPPIPD